MLKSSLFGEIKVNLNINQLFSSSLGSQSGSSQIGTNDTTNNTTIVTTIGTKDTAKEKNTAQPKPKEKIGKNKLKKLKKLNELGAPQVLPLPLKTSTLITDVAIHETRREKIGKVIEKNSRTLFVGNLPVDVIEKKNTTLLKSHFCQFGGDLESVRFRSLAFSEKMPRKQAFIARKLHEGRDSLNAYLVFTNLEHAMTAKDKLDGQVFMSRHLRVDVAEQKQEKKRDSKRCVFLGNLGFDVSDEAVWDFFKAAGLDDIEYVRLIRDHKTNVGKGFGYVQFTDRASVSLAMECNGNVLAGRKVRITRAKEELAQVSKKPTTTTAEEKQAPVLQQKKNGKRLFGPSVELGARASRMDSLKKFKKRSASSGSSDKKRGVSKKSGIKKPRHKSRS